MSDSQALSPNSRVRAASPELLDEHGLRPAPSVMQRALAIIRTYPLGVTSGVVLVLFTVAAVAAPLLAPYQPTEFLSVGPLAGPSPDAWLGTDQIGRDLFTRILYGARTSLLIATSATVAGMALGGVLGLLSGYAGGALDMVLQRAMDVMDAIPALILAILLVALLGPSSVNVAVAVGVVLVPGANRVARSVTLGSRQLTYVEAANALGASPWRVMLRHLAPGLLPALVILAASAFGGAIVTEASLSFLGLGPPPPTPTWGQMLSGDVRQYFITDPWLAIVPGVAITVAVLCASLGGDALRDALDPRLKRH